MLNRKPTIERHQKAAEKKLAARLEKLTSKGMTDRQIKRDPKLRHFEAQVRKAKLQLAGIVKLEAQIAKKAEIRAQKAATPKTDEAKPKKSSAESKNKKARREKKAAAVAVEAED